MSIPLIFIPAALLVGLYESLPKRDRKIRHERRRNRNNKRIVW